MNEEKVLQVTKALQIEGHHCLGIKCDVTNEEEIVRAIQFTVQEYGSLDILINNTGAIRGVYRGVSDTTI